MYENIQLISSGDQVIFVQFGGEINPDINRQVHDFDKSLHDKNINAVVDTIPGYKSLMIQYDPMQISTENLETKLLEIKNDSSEQIPRKKTIVNIPVLYQGKYAPDLEFVAKHNNLKTEEVIRIHSETEYLVYMIGFTPGFPYLGGLPSRLSTPRMSTPRLKIEKGSVGIAETQTGIYPASSPGGWRIIGRTPLLLFDTHNDPPSILSAGNYIRFYPIKNENDFIKIQKLSEKLEYEINIEIVS
jgi:KipI family sensor histidine kinase inhibitor